jgi:phenylacetic acid degradation protein PaaD
MSKNLPIIETLFNADPTIQQSGIELIASSVGSVTLALTVEQRHLNFNGTCHGGVVFTLADTAFGLAGNSHGTVAAGINTTISYHAGSRPGDRLVATAKETARSKSLGTCYVEVMRNDEKLVASLTGTSFITGDKHDLDSDKYPSLKSA